MATALSASHHVVVFIFLTLGLLLVAARGSQVTRHRKPQSAHTKPTATSAPLSLRLNLINLDQAKLLSSTTTGVRDNYEEDNSIDQRRPPPGRRVQVPSIDLNQFRSSHLVKTSNLYVVDAESATSSTPRHDHLTMSSTMAASINNSLDYLHAKFARYQNISGVGGGAEKNLTKHGGEFGMFEMTTGQQAMTTAAIFGILEKIVIGFILYALTIWTIIGNIFVCIALYTNKQLKQGGISNYLIGNLALSDLLLGVTVLPFSATFSTFQDWIFGSLWCDIWLSIDVLCCTASIWGLLVISLDRFIATNHPIIYRKQKNSLQVAVIYCTVSWVISIVISLAPLLMPDSDTGAVVQGHNDTQAAKMPNLHSFDNGQRHECILFKKPSFVLLSSFGSFYLPLILMILLYWRVFAKIRQQSKLFHNNTNASSAAKPGRKSMGSQTEVAKKSLLATQTSLDKSKTATIIARVSDPLATPAADGSSKQQQLQEQQKLIDTKQQQSEEMASTPPPTATRKHPEDVESIESEFSPTIQAASLISTAIAAAPMAFSSLSKAPKGGTNNMDLADKRKSMLTKQSTVDTISVSSKNGNMSRILIGKSLMINVTSNLSRKGKLKSNTQTRSISNSEARVTKTLAIIMFCFVACWLPFFFIYNVRSLLRDQEQIPAVLMDMFIWLGYLNSSLNPILYAILNRNFRIAFKDILACRCFKRF